jgi:Ca2+/Na+ antiporter
MFKKIYQRLFWDYIRISGIFTRKKIDIENALEDFIRLNIIFKFSITTFSFFLITFSRSYLQFILVLLTWMLLMVWSYYLRRNREKLFKLWKKEFYQKEIKITSINYFFVYLLFITTLYFITSGLYIEYFEK